MCKVPDVSQVETRPGWRIKQVQQLLRHAGDDALRTTGLSVSQYAVLRALADLPGASSAEVARRCFVTRQSLSDVLGGLRAAELVVPDPASQGRSRPTILTATGRARLEEAERTMAAVEDRMLAGLSAREVATLGELLGVCAANLA
jgi:DNA-binding MarR family transcriptional regulator